ncbi:alpha-1,2-Mannosidase [Mycena venus]|uniref:mannosyl-oligosaccharide 1,2-alpha-mannosidase n=1 Tax=Mycena venus TaxID=2733690 RepID=A0A8H6XH34_9AGAR|nr:alpha-1,2-Mannosidase [Mycena venus]
MVIMGLEDIFLDAVNFSSKIDFRESKINQIISGYKNLVLLAKATEVADKLAFAWAGTNIAEAGSLTLEWSTLSKYTKNAMYENLATKSVKHIANLPAPLPGLAAQTVDPTSGDFVGAYVNTYASTVTGIGPELFAFFSEDGNFTGGDPPTTDQFVNDHGFYITLSLYVLRSEGMCFASWFSSFDLLDLIPNTTGDTKYLDRASAAIDSFNKWLAVSSGGLAGLGDVNSDNGGFWDVMESFWFAEVLKYLYLTFDDPKHISLDNHVFNTECQPFKTPPALNSYKGSGKWLPSKQFTLNPGAVTAPTIYGLLLGDI